MAISYKHKIYMGKSINWNQMLDKSKFPTTGNYDGVIYTNNTDGTITLNGTATDVTNYNLQNEIHLIAGHKYLCYCHVSYIGSGMYVLLYTTTNSYDTLDNKFFTDGKGICTALKDSNSIHYQIKMSKGNIASNLIIKPQLFDLTQMFGAGNEPSTVEEFWSYFSNQVYPYNAGETQPLFKISRKRKLYMGKSVEWNQMLQNPNFSNTVVDTLTHVSFRVQQLASPYDSFLGPELQEPGVVSAVFTIPVSGNCRIKHNGSVYDIDFCYFTSVKDHKYYIYFNFTSTNPSVVGGITYNKAQLFDLTQMFGAGNEPSTPEEFWSYFENKVYPYNEGETQPLFKISRKSVYGGSVVSYPKKGDLITLDGKEYRVLKTEGSVAEVLAMYNSTDSQKFDTSGKSNVYANSSLDVYLSQTFYNSLSTATQNAIVAKTFQQDSWYYGSKTDAIAKYNGTYQTTNNYTLSLMSTTFGTSISRKCYVLSCQDVIDYLEVTTSMGAADTTLTSENVWRMFWNQTTSPSSTYLWLRSADSGYSSLAFSVIGNLNSNIVDFTSAVRPAFQIDLNKISYTPATQSLYVGENLVIPQTVSD